MDMLDGETEVRDYNLERLMMLSDGVFAIAMTLLALDLRPPANWNHQLGSLVHLTAPRLLSYGFSVVWIAAYWIRHRRTFGRIYRADLGLTLFNFVVLALITLVPAATSLLWEFKAGEAGSLVYLGLLIAIGLASFLQWVYAAFVANLVKASVSRRARMIDAVQQLLIPAATLLLGVIAFSVTSLKTAAVAAVAVLASLVAIRRWARRVEKEEADLAKSKRVGKAA